MDYKLESSGRAWVIKVLEDVLFVKVFFPVVLVVSVLEKVPLKHLFLEFQVVLIMIVLLHVIVDTVVQRVAVGPGVSAT